MTAVTPPSAAASTCSATPRAAARLPGTSLVYKSGTSVQRSWSTGVSYQEVLNNGWLLKDANGAYVLNVRYGAFVADIGNPAYQQRFVDNVAAFLKRNGNDGVFIDDVLATPIVLTGGVYPAKYPTREEWEEATVSFIAKVGGDLRARGFYVLAQANGWIPNDPSSDSGSTSVRFWTRLAPNVSGLQSEYWLQNPIDVAQLRAVGTRWYENWTGWQALSSVARSAGVDFFALMYGGASDVQTMRFGRGSFLLDWSGKGGAFIYYARDQDDPYHPAWVTEFGLPLKPKFERAPGVWQRKYARGIVVVNATNEPVTVRVNGALQTIEPTDALFSPNSRR